MAKTITAEVVMGKISKFGTRGVKDTEGKWWDFEPDAVTFGEGATVSIEAATGAKKNKVTRFTVIKGGKSGGGSSAPTGGGGGRSGSGASGDYSEVNWNASVARAVEIVGLLLANDAVALGPKTAKPADRQAVILDVLDEITARCFTDIKERRPLKKAKELAEDLGEGSDEADEDGDDFSDDDL
jgi:hypothetical protein